MGCSVNIWRGMARSVAGAGAAVTCCCLASGSDVQAIRKRAVMERAARAVRRRSKGKPRLFRWDGGSGRREGVRRRRGGGPRGGKKSGPMQ